LKKKEKLNEKKRKNRKVEKKSNFEKKKGKESLWIVVAIHSDLGVGNSDSLTPFR
jgi:hypothetical protein